jgi:disulfide bond formation protein DsbB
MTLKSHYLYGGLSFSCCLFLAYAFYAQYVQHFEPCPLCYFQRAVIIILGILWLINTCAVRRLTGLQFGLQILFCLLGNALAVRHLWIQLYPETAKGSCGMGIQYMMDTYPFLEVILKSWKGTIDCTDASWRILGLTAPAWLILLFSGMTLLTIFAYVRRPLTSQPSAQ